MLGRASAAGASGRRRWLLRLWGTPDIHARLKWSVVWPVLAPLPRGGVRLLDAGCGDGAWTLELAARRPGWRLTGVDRDGACIARADAARARLGLRNVRFEAADFLAFDPPEPFDVVLSVGSAHYLAAEGRGGALFRRFGAWLRPGGLLILLGPRRGAEVPIAPLLPPPFTQRGLFGRAELEGLVAEADLVFETLTPATGRLGTLAKQLSRATAHHRALAAVSYPFQIALAALDRPASPDAGGRSAAWLLRARRPLAFVAPDVVAAEVP